MAQNTYRLGDSLTRKITFELSVLVFSEEVSLCRLRMMDEDMIRRIAQKDPTQINSAYIISMFSEDYFKEMMDEYVGKVLVSGKAPSSEEQL